MAVSSPHTTTTSTNVLSPASNSPHSKTLTRPLFKKAGRTEQDLGLKLIIGTTTTSSNAFDALPGSRCIGYLAGAVAVVGRVDTDGSISQTYFRSKQLLIPNTGGTPLNEISSNPLSPSHNSRNRTPVRQRDSPSSPSSFTSSLYSSLDSPSSKNGTNIVEKVKPLVSISFSPNGTLLAVGEVGHKPRVLIYSMRYAGQDPLLSAISEHTFGVRFLAFSPNSNLLASLGDVNDGFLYIWNVNSRNGSYSLKASNKCTTAVKHMAWLGKNLVTVGTRHVKVWTVEATITQESGNKPLADQLNTLSLNSPRTLSGHNCLLGSLLDKTFTAVVAIADDKAVVCSEDGHICLLENAEASARLSFVGDAGFQIYSATLLSPSLLLVGGHNGKMRLFGLQKMLSAPGDGERMGYDQGIQVTVGQTSNSIIAMGFLGSQVIILDDKRTIQTLSCDPTGTIESKVRTVSAHGGTPTGSLSLPQPNQLYSAFITWALNGNVLFWDQSGGLKHKANIILKYEQVEDGDYPNELRVVRMMDFECTRILSGDRHGVLRVTNAMDGDCINEVKAHQGDITDIAVCRVSEKWNIITAGRDRMIQVFCWKDDKLWLVQTLNDHVGAVSGLVLLQDGKRLVSCSADRNIIIRDLVSADFGDHLSAYIKTRSIVLKATPLALAVNVKRDNGLLVSTNDKQVLECDLSIGASFSAFKSSDAEDSSSVVLSNIAQVRGTENESGFVAGISNNDKSVRLYDMAGNLRARDYGHTEGLTSICCVESSDESEGYSLVTTATDGTIYLWQPQVGNQEKFGSVQDPVKEDTAVASQAPVRRVLSSAELAQLQELRAPTEKAEGGTTSRPASPKRNPSKLSQVQLPDASASAIATAPRRMSQAVPPPLLISTSTSTSTSQPRKGRSESIVSRPHSPASPRTHSPMSSTGRFTDISDRRRKSLSTGSPTTAEVNVILSATEQMCRSLQLYRKKFAISNRDNLPDATIHELEKELGITAKLLASRRNDSKQQVTSVDTVDTSVARTSPVPPGIDEERLMNLLEARLEARLLSKMGQKNTNQGDGEHDAVGKAEDLTVSGAAQQPDDAKIRTGDMAAQQYGQKNH